MCIIHKHNIHAYAHTHTSKHTHTHTHNMSRQNNVLELWSLFDFLLPGFLGTERQFFERFGKPILLSREAKSSSREQEAGKPSLYHPPPPPPPLSLSLCHMHTHKWAWLNPFSEYILKVISTQLSVYIYTCTCSW